MESLQSLLFRPHTEFKKAYESMNPRWVIALYMVLFLIQIGIAIASAFVLKNVLGADLVGGDLGGIGWALGNVLFSGFLMILYVTAVTFGIARLVKSFGKSIDFRKSAKVFLLSLYPVVIFSIVLGTLHLLVTLASFVIGQDFYAVANIILSCISLIYYVAWVWHFIILVFGIRSVSGLETGQSFIVGCVPYVVVIVAMLIFTVCLVVAGVGLIGGFVSNSFGSYGRSVVSDF